MGMHGPDVLMIAIGELPSFGVALMMALLMPLCGYLGAQRGHAPLVGAFGACSFLSCCCGSLDGAVRPHHLHATDDAYRAESCRGLPGGRALAGCIQAPFPVGAKVPCRLPCDGLVAVPPWRE